MPIDLKANSFLFYFVVLEEELTDFSVVVWSSELLLGYLVDTLNLL